MVQLLAIIRAFCRACLPLGMLLLLFSCSDRVPEGIIPPKKMADVLFDVHLADGMLANKPIDSARLQMASLYEAIFGRYGIDSAVLRHSVVYYASRPAVMKAMYTQIEERMNAVVEAEQEALNERYRLERQADSIRSARVSDSLRRVGMLQLDMERKRHLLFVPTADSTFDAAVPVTPKTLRDRLYEEIRLSEAYIGALYSPLGTPNAVAPMDSTETAIPELPLPPPSTPETVNPSPARRLLQEEVRLQ